jgi:hypothetical protein
MAGSKERHHHPASNKISEELCVVLLFEDVRTFSIQALINAIREVGIARLLLAPTFHLKASTTQPTGGSTA